LNKERNEIKFYRKNAIEIVHGNSSHSFPLHSHDCFCIGIVIDGKLNFKLNTEDLVLGKNEVYFVPPFTEHTISAIDNKPYSYQVICVPDMFTTIDHPLSFNTYVFDSRKGKVLLNELEIFKNSHNYQQLFDNMLEFIRANINPEKRLKKQRNTETVTPMAAYIQAQINEPFNLQNLCDFSHLTKYHLLRLFKEQMGVTPYQFYIQEKIRKTRQGLLEEQPAANIANDLEFSDQSHLCNTFKKHVGLTLKQFQKSYESE
jgi:AraC-like DNA-binding protein